MFEFYSLIPARRVYYWESPKVQLGADVDATTSCGRTPLFFAACRGHSAAARTLLDLSANPCVVTASGETASRVGLGHLDLETQALLEASEASGSHPWRNFFPAHSEQIMLETPAGRNDEHLDALTEGGCEAFSLKLHVTRAWEGKGVYLDCGNLVVKIDCSFLRAAIK